VDKEPVHSVVPSIDMTNNETDENNGSCASHANSASLGIAVELLLASFEKKMLSRCLIANTLDQLQYSF
jgi:hypothetical protein